MISVPFSGYEQVYDQGINRARPEVSDEANLNVRRGNYAGLSGPSFEKPADVVFEDGWRGCVECPRCPSNRGAPRRAARVRNFWDLEQN